MKHKLFATGGNGQTRPQAADADAAAAPDDTVDTGDTGTAAPAAPPISATESTK